MLEQKPKETNGTQKLRTVVQASGGSEPVKKYRYTRVASSLPLFPLTKNKTLRSDFFTGEINYGPLASKRKQMSQETYFELLNGIMTELNLSDLRVLRARLKKVEEIYNKLAKKINALQKVKKELRGEITSGSKSTEELKAITKEITEKLKIEKKWETELAGLKRVRESLKVQIKQNQPVRAEAEPPVVEKFEISKGGEDMEPKGGIKAEEKKAECSKVDSATVDFQREPMEDGVISYSHQEANQLTLLLKTFFYTDNNSGNIKKIGTDLALDAMRKDIASYAPPPILAYIPPFFWGRLFYGKDKGAGVRAKLGKQAEQIATQLQYHKQALAMRAYDLFNDDPGAIPSEDLPFYEAAIKEYGNFKVYNIPLEDLGKFQQSIEGKIDDYQQQINKIKWWHFRYKGKSAQKFKGELERKCNELKTIRENYSSFHNVFDSIFGAEALALDSSEAPTTKFVDDLIAKLKTQLSSKSKSNEGNGVSDVTMFDKCKSFFSKLGFEKSPKNISANDISKKVAADLLAKFRKAYADKDLTIESLRTKLASETPGDKEKNLAVIEAVRKEIKKQRPTAFLSKNRKAMQQYCDLLLKHLEQMERQLSKDEYTNKARDTHEKFVVVPSEKASEKSETELLLEYHNRKNSAKKLRPVEQKRPFGSSFKRLLKTRLGKSFAIKFLTSANAASLLPEHSVRKLFEKLKGKDADLTDPEINELSAVISRYLNGEKNYFNDTRAVQERGATSLESRRENLKNILENKKTDIKNIKDLSSRAKEALGELCGQALEYLKEPDRTLSQRFELRKESISGDYGALQNLMFEHGSDPEIRKSLLSNIQYLINDAKSKVDGTEPPYFFNASTKLKLTESGKLKALTILSSLIKGEVVDITDTYTNLIKAYISTERMVNEESDYSDAMHLIGSVYVLKHLQELLLQLTKDDSTLDVSKQKELLVKAEHYFNFINKYTEFKALKQYEGLGEQAFSYFKELLLRKEDINIYSDKEVFKRHEKRCPFNLVHIKAQWKYAQLFKKTKEDVKELFSAYLDGSFTVRLTKLVRSKTIKEDQKIKCLDIFEEAEHKSKLSAYLEEILKDDVAELEAIKMTISNKDSSKNHDGSKSGYAEVFLLTEDEALIKEFMLRRLNYILREDPKVIELNKEDKILFQTVKGKYSSAWKSFNEGVKKYIKNKRIPCSTATRDNFIEAYCNIENKQLYRAKMLRQELKKSVKTQYSNADYRTKAKRSYSTSPELNTLISWIKSKDSRGLEKYADEVVEDHLAEDFELVGANEPKAHEKWTAATYTIAINFCSRKVQNQVHTNLIVSLLGIGKKGGAFEDNQLNEINKFIGKITSDKLIIRNPIKGDSWAAVNEEIDTAIQDYLEHNSANEICTIMALNFASSDVLWEVRKRGILDILNSKDSKNLDKAISFIKSISEQKTHDGTIRMIHESPESQVKFDSLLDKYLSCPWDEVASYFIEAFGSQKLKDDYRLLKLEEELEHGDHKTTEKYLLKLERLRGLGPEKRSGNRDPALSSFVETMEGKNKLLALLRKYVSKKPCKLNTYMVLHWLEDKKDGKQLKEINKLKKSWNHSRFSELLEHDGCHPFYKEGEFNDYGFVYRFQIWIAGNRKGAFTALKKQLDSSALKDYDLLRSLIFESGYFKEIENSGLEQKFIDFLIQELKENDQIEKNNGREEPSKELFEYIESMRKVLLDEKEEVEVREDKVLGYLTRLVRSLVMTKPDQLYDRDESLHWAPSNECATGPKPKSYESLFGSEIEDSLKVGETLAKYVDNLQKICKTKPEELSKVFTADAFSICEQYFRGKFVESLKTKKSRYSYLAKRIDAVEDTYKTFKGIIDNSYAFKKSDIIVKDFKARLDCDAFSSAKTLYIDFTKDWSDHVYRTSPKAPNIKKWLKAMEEAMLEHTKEYVADKGSQDWLEAIRDAVTNLHKIYSTDSATSDSKANSIHQCLFKIHSLLGSIPEHASSTVREMVKGVLGNELIITIVENSLKDKEKEVQSKIHKNKNNVEQTKKLTLKNKAVKKLRELLTNKNKFSEVKDLLLYVYGVKDSKSYDELVECLINYQIAIDTADLALLKTTYRLLCQHSVNSEYYFLLSRLADNFHSLPVGAKKSIDENIEKLIEKFSGVKSEPHLKTISTHLFKGITTFFSDLLSHVTNSLVKTKLEGLVGKLNSMKADQILVFVQKMQTGLETKKVNTPEAFRKLCFQQFAALYKERGDKHKAELNKLESVSEAKTYIDSSLISPMVGFIRSVYAENLSKHNENDYFKSVMELLTVGLKYGIKAKETVHEHEGLVCHFSDLNIQKAISWIKENASKINPAFARIRDGLNAILQGKNLTLELKIEDFNILAKGLDKTRLTQVKELFHKVLEKMNCSFNDKPEHFFNTIYKALYEGVAVQSKEDEEIVFLNNIFKLFNRLYQNKFIPTNELKMLAKNLHVVSTQISSTSIGLLNQYIDSLQAKPGLGEVAIIFKQALQGGVLILNSEDEVGLLELELEPSEAPAEVKEDVFLVKKSLQLVNINKSEKAPHNFESTIQEYALYKEFEKLFGRSKKIPNDLLIKLQASSEYIKNMCKHLTATLTNKSDALLVNNVALLMSDLFSDEKRRNLSNNYFNKVFNSLKENKLLLVLERRIPLINLCIQYSTVSKDEISEFINCCLICLRLDNFAPELGDIINLHGSSEQKRVWNYLTKIYELHKCLESDAFAASVPETIESLNQFKKIEVVDYILVNSYNYWNQTLNGKDGCLGLVAKLKQKPKHADVHQSEQILSDILSESNKASTVTRILGLHGVEAKIDGLFGTEPLGLTPAVKQDEIIKRLLDLDSKKLKDLFVPSDDVLKNKKQQTLFNKALSTKKPSVEGLEPKLQKLALMLIHLRSVISKTMVDYLLIDDKVKSAEAIRGMGKARRIKKAKEDAKKTRGSKNFIQKKVLNFKMGLQTLLKENKTVACGEWYAETVVQALTSITEGKSFSRTCEVLSDINKTKKDIISFKGVCEDFMKVHSDVADASIYFTTSLRQLREKFETIQSRVLKGVENIKDIRVLQQFLEQFNTDLLEAEKLEVPGEELKTDGAKIQAVKAAVLQKIKETYQQHRNLVILAKYSMSLNELDKMQRSDFTTIAEVQKQYQDKREQLQGIVKLIPSSVEAREQFYDMFTKQVNERKRAYPDGLYYNPKYGKNSSTVGSLQLLLERSTSEQLKTSKKTIICKTAEQFEKTLLQFMDQYKSVEYLKVLAGKFLNPIKFKEQLQSSDEIANLANYTKLKAQLASAFECVPSDEPKLPNIFIENFNKMGSDLTSKLCKDRIKSVDDLKVALKDCIDLQYYGSLMGEVVTQRNTIKRIMDDANNYVNPLKNNRTTHSSMFSAESLGKEKKEMEEENTKMLGLLNSLADTIPESEDDAKAFVKMLNVTLRIELDEPTSFTKKNFKQMLEDYWYSKIYIPNFTRNFKYENLVKEKGSTSTSRITRLKGLLDSFITTLPENNTKILNVFMNEYFGKWAEKRFQGESGLTVAKVQTEVAKLFNTINLRTVECSRPRPLTDRPYEYSFSVNQKLQPAMESVAKAGSSPRLG